MAALVPRMEVETEGGHVGIMSGQLRQRKNQHLSSDCSKLDRRLQNWMCATDGCSGSL